MDKASKKKKLAKLKYSQFRGNKAEGKAMGPRDEECIAAEDPGDPLPIPYPKKYSCAFCVEY